MRILVCLLLVALLGTARADDDQIREDARKEFAAGQAADRKRDWKKAIEHYRRANDLVPHPFALYNIAIDYKRLGQRREAARWFERYLDSAPSVANRDKVERMLLELQQHPAKVAIRSNPPGAAIRINGLPSGSTPLETELKSGYYVIVVEKQGERDSREVNIEYGEPLNVDFTLRGATAVTPPPRTEPVEPPPPNTPNTPTPAASSSLYIYGEPPGAQITVDGAVAGVVPARIAVEPGKRRVRVTAFGHAPYDTTVIAAANAETPVAIRLTRGLEAIPPTTRPIQVGYLFGGGGGYDVGGKSPYVATIEFGGRAGQYDLAVRLGRLGNVKGADILVRGAFTKARFAPFALAGYSYVQGGYGFIVGAGLRWDVVRSEKGGISLLAEAAYRLYHGTPSEPGENPGTDAEAKTEQIIPIMASLLFVYR